VGKQKQGKLIIFSAPSGSGKTTLARYLLSELPQLAFSVSACSRKMRPGEVNGKDYYFLSIEEFKRKIRNKEFVEYEEVYPDHFYGTLYSEIERIWDENKAVLFDVDVVGGANLKKIFSEKALAVFVRPPSIKILRERLKKRGTDSAKAINIRLAKVEFELGFESQFDTVVVNNDIEIAKKETLNIVQNFLSN
jgi:guanylate kinase